METKEEILNGLKDIYARMLAAETGKKHLLKNIIPSNCNSAINLTDYLALRAENIEDLQVKLHNYGLSSLASSESHIKYQVVQVMRLLGDETSKAYEVDAYSGPRQLQHNICQLLGIDGKKDDTPPIMVTFAAHFAEDLDLLCDLLKNGMRLARINCAHDEQLEWAKMVASLQKAKARTGLPCKLYMDIAGPKIRTRVIGGRDDHGKMSVEVGQDLLLTDPGKKAIKGTKFIACTLPGIIEHLKPGQRIFFDDGLFQAVVQQVKEKEAIVKITRISAKKPIIKSQKGINFPDTSFSINSITDFDKECLPFIVKHADLLGFSFVNRAADIEQLQMYLQALGKPGFPIVAKIETSQAFVNLPEIILQGMHQKQFGVMVARGDLAIEIGFERMSEVQDEILYICEAAHVPVIWATQVLETMNKHGIATRSEVTDAAHAAAADCVMLNKGAHTAEALRSLTDILCRSRKNSLKNRRLFRKLSIARHFFSKRN